MLYADLQAGHYLDAQYGVVSNSTGSCDNYHLFSAEAAEVADWILWPQYATFFKACEVEPGLITRYPHRVGGGISQDEMIGAATLDSNAAERIYDYGEAHHWYFDPDKTPFTWANWYGRFIDFKPYIKLRAGHKLNLWDKLAWSMMTVLSPMSEYSNTSGKILKWIQLRKMQGNNRICDLAIKYWKYRMKREYPGGIRTVMWIYFGESHPLMEYARKDFE